MHIILFAVTAVGTSKLEDVAKFFQIIINVCKKLLLHLLAWLGWNGKKYNIAY
jgi:hypothetical protein